MSDSSDPHIKSAPGAAEQKDQLNGQRLFPYDQGEKYVLGSIVYLMACGAFWMAGFAIWDQLHGGKEESGWGDVFLFHTFQGNTLVT